MKIIKHHSTMYNMQFKKVKLWIDHNLAIFLNYTNNDYLNISSISNDFLLKKFDLYDWDDIVENLPHIKFLIKYSPILSKFIDISEFDTIEFASSSDQIVDNWCNVSYINLNDGKEFFNVYDATHTEQDVISLEIDSEFLKILKEGNRSQ